MIDFQQERSTPLLPCCDWFIPSTEVLPEGVASWLQDQHSTTAKFKQLSHCLQIECCFAGYVARSDLGAEAAALPFASEPLWLREVVMVADGMPWLYGRSLIPQSLLEDEALALATLGNTPLGERLFTLTPPPQRSDLEVVGITPPLALTTRIASPSGQCWWARRSRLTLPQGSLLLTELFLPAAPLYRELHG